MANDIEIKGVGNLNGAPTVERAGDGVRLNVRLTVWVDQPWTIQQLEALMTSDLIAVTMAASKKGPK